MSAFPEVKGDCPMGCGPTLFLGATGHVTCSAPDCPDPARVDAMLRECAGVRGNMRQLAMRLARVAA